MQRSSRATPARAVFGDWTLRELEGAADDVADWRSRLPDTSRYRLTAAMRQTLGAAVRWNYIGRNPAVEAGKNPEPPQEELLPFTRGQLEALVAELGSLYGPLVVVAAETELRTNEWIALERHDVDRAGRAVTVQRRHADGVLTGYPKTERSCRRVPLTARAPDALDLLPPRLDTPLLFPASRGGYVQLDTGATASGTRRSTRPGSPGAGPTTCGTRFATEGLAGGVSIFELARLMGTSVKMIDRTYGHLAQDSEDAIRARLEARALPTPRGAQASESPPLRRQVAHDAERAAHALGPARARARTARD